MLASAHELTAPAMRPEMATVAVSAQMNAAELAPVCAEGGCDGECAAAFGQAEPEGETARRDG